MRDDDEGRRGKNPKRTENKEKDLESEMEQPVQHCVRPREIAESSITHTVGPAGSDRRRLPLSIDCLYEARSQIQESEIRICLYHHVRAAVLQESDASELGR